MVFLLATRSSCGCGSPSHDNRGARADVGRSGLEGDISALLFARTLRTLCLTLALLRFGYADLGFPGFSVTKDEINEYFKSHGAGNITEVKLMTGFGFLEYEDPMDARDVVPGKLDMD
jgi:RNA recognition motif. (a.k.a. RRM, RBD, or RNP domain)